MKKWINPQISGLAVDQTKTEGEVVQWGYESDGRTKAFKIKCLGVLNTLTGILTPCSTPNKLYADFEEFGKHAKIAHPLAKNEIFEQTTVGY